MTSYSLNLPNELKQEAENWASQQGIPLEAFMLDAIAEKVKSLNQQLNDPSFPHITYRRGASGQLVPILRGTNLRVQTVVIAAQQWSLSPSQIAAEYDLNEAQVNDALAFYNVHRSEIDDAIAAEQALEAAHV
ncbi:MULTISPECIES: DUF433 domain-containing protein [unclassified Coleofasciculus]|uniref:DUF433 domain-containing protein n=1 Tax=unclassified Coleofasciculus TaxID=2692782 RepID=UPI00187FC547|nr:MULTISPECIES: DUF433 domain-containing protein [unclassified Coleofasciculus]MBE9129956.1 DUF433 domain-containing protein [Coleofasciculus sp. LEGE 07081]MBE9150409.1 DUF433 domain-containing protein [Coleofasciculus sp. LEGE 07092]